MMDQGKILAEGSLSQLLEKFREGDLIEYAIGLSVGFFLRTKENTL